MSCYLAGEEVINGAIEQDINNGICMVTVRGPTFSAAQVAACSAACNGSTVSCGDGTTTYTGQCIKCCVVSCGCKAFVVVDSIE